MSTPRATRPPPRWPRLLLRSARGTVWLAAAAVNPEQVPDPWLLELCARRLDRLHAIAERRTDDRPAWGRLRAAIERHRDLLAKAIEARRAQRAAMKRRPVRLLLAQGDAQMRAFAAQCNHRALVLNPIERIAVIEAALAEILRELDAHGPDGLGAEDRARVDALRVQAASVGARLQRVTALREITPVRELLAAVRREVGRVEKMIGAGTVRSDGVGSAQVYARRLLELEFLVVGVADAFGRRAMRRLVARIQRRRLRLMGVGVSDGTLGP
jgi:hypothetical protein